MKKEFGGSVAGYQIRTQFSTKKTWVTWFDYSTLSWNDSSWGSVSYYVKHQGEILNSHAASFCQNNY